MIFDNYLIYFTKLDKNLIKQKCGQMTVQIKTFSKHSKGAGMNWAASDWCLGAVFEFDHLINTHYHMHGKSLHAWDLLLLSILLSTCCLIQQFFTYYSK